MTGSVLVAEDLRKQYGRRIVLKGVSFRADAGSLVGIVGENGSGKTTLLKILAGLLPPSEGSVRVDGKIGYCPQQVMLNESLTVRQHLEYFAAAYRLSDSEHGLELVRRLAYEEYLDRAVSELSGGTQQKLNLTLGVMHQPDVLHLDEPYQGFDWETYLRFWGLAQDLRSGGACVLVISHLVFDKARFDVIYDLKGGLLRPESSTKSSAGAPS